MTEDGVARAHRRPAASTAQRPSAPAAAEHDHTDDDTGAWRCDPVTLHEVLPDVPDTAACRSAFDVATEYYSPAMFNHCVRAYLWAAHLGAAELMNVDAELLYVAGMLHDLGLITEFDNHMLPFEVGGGHVAAVFAAGAGWPAERRRHVADAIVAHMADSVDRSAEPEGFLLERATAFDISGRAPEDFPDELRSAVLDRYPRLDLAAEFLACFEEQARRKPQSQAAAAVRTGIGRRLAANPLEGR